MSNFSHKDGAGNLKQVPVLYGDLTRQVANIIRDNSENKIPSAPRMSIYVTGLELDPALESADARGSVALGRGRAPPRGATEASNQDPGQLHGLLEPRTLRRPFSVGLGA